MSNEKSPILVTRFLENKCEKSLKNLSAVSSNTTTRRKKRRKEKKKTSWARNKNILVPGNAGDEKNLFFLIDTTEFSK